MKKSLLTLLVSAVTFSVFIQSCQKDEGDDLTTEIVGTYDATITDSVVNTSNDVYSNETVTIARVDNSHIRVTSTYSNFLDYEATLTETETGLLLNIPSQQSNGETIAGYDISVNGVSANGSFNSSTGVLGSLVRAETGSNTVIQGCEANKQ